MDVCFVLHLITSECLLAAVNCSKTLETENSQWNESLRFVVWWEWSGTFDSSVWQQINVPWSTDRNELIVTNKTPIKQRNKPQRWAAFIFTSVLDGGGSQMWARGAGEPCSFTLNVFAIKKVWKLQMKVRVSKLQTDEQKADKESMQERCYNWSKGFLMMKRDLNCDDMIYQVSAVNCGAHLTLFNKLESFSSSIFTVLRVF